MLHATLFTIFSLKSHSWFFQSEKNKTFCKKLCFWIKLQRNRCRSSTSRYYKALQGTKSGTTRCYEVLWGTTSSTRSHYKLLRVVLQDTTRYYKWYYEILGDTTSGTTKNYQVMRGVLWVEKDFVYFDKLIHILKIFQH